METQSDSGRILAQQEEAVTAWLAGTPALRSEAALVVALVDDLIALLAPYHIQSAWTSEPRTYRLESRGQLLLTEALLANRVDSLVLASPARGGGGANATVYVGLGSERDRDLAATVDVTLRPTPDVTRLEIVDQLIAFITRWFTPLRAASAFVSFAGIIEGRQIGDTPSVTAYEQEHRLPRPMRWSALCRYARGSFWGTGLGPDLCNRLGGRERVLQEAPVALARPLGDGVWLQLSNMPPPDPAAVSRLARYLSLLLNWTREDILPPDLLMLSPPQRARAATPSSPGVRSQPVPLRVLANAGTDLGINVYLTTPPTPTQRSTIEATIDAWYQEGFNGAFGGVGFHDLSGPSLEGNVLRWRIDFGSADPHRALRTLADRLAILPGVTVDQLVAGIEDVG